MLMIPFFDRYRNDNFLEFWGEENYLKRIYTIEVDFYCYMTDSDSDLRNHLVSLYEYKQIKEIEKEHKHDVVSVVYFLRGILQKKYPHLPLNMVHYGLTSQDLVSMAYTTMVNDFVSKFVVDKIASLEDSFSKLFSNKILLGRTHGQPATPIYGNNLVEMFNGFMPRQFLFNLNMVSRFGRGACGDRFSLSLLEPSKNLSKFFYSVDKILEQYGMERCPSKQTDFYPYILDVLRYVEDKSLFLKNEAKNLWMLCMTKQLQMKNHISQSGSSAMPQKVNPIKFEKAEGNFHLTSDFSSSIRRKILESRLERDLSDISVMRNLGLSLVYFCEGLDSFAKGLRDCEVSKQIFDDVGVFAEFITLYLKPRYPNMDVYTEMKKVFKGNKLSLKNLCENLLKIEIAKDDVEKIKNKIQTYYE